MPYEVRRVGEDELQSWFDCLALTFQEHLDVDRIIGQLRPFWDMSRVWGAFDDRVVGTLRTWASELTVPGGALLPASAVTAVTVRPTHRRRGVLRALIGAEHAAARDRGEAISMLYSAESPIYGRFGYGPAVTGCEWVLDTLGTQFIGQPATGVDIVPLDETTRDLMRDLHERLRRRQVGDIRRREVTFGMEIGLVEVSWGAPWKGWVAMHRDAVGEPDGYVRYSVDSKWEQGQPRSIVNIQDLITLNDSAYDQLWQFLADLDLVAKVRLERGSPSERLPWLLTNSRAADPSGMGDGLWVHLLDIPRALAARTYERAGDLTLEVIDGEPGTGQTRVRLEAGTVGASCTVTSRDPDLTVHANALGAAYLGGTPLRHAALGRGFEEHRSGALDEATVLFRTIEEPRCSTFF